MEDLALQFLVLEPGAILVLNLLFICAGGALGWLTWRGNLGLRRVTYFLVTAGLLLALSTLQLAWFGAPAAVASGNFWGVIVASLAALVAFGYANWMAGAARSRDIGGDAGKAVLAFVPVANLYLIFARAENATALAAQRSRAARYIADPLLVFVGLCALAAGDGATAALKQSQDSIWASSPEAAARISQALGPVAWMQTTAATMQSDLPIQVDEVTRLVAVSAEAGTLTYDYRIDAQLEAFPPEFGDELASKACRAEVFGAALAVGGRVVHHYVRSDGAVLLHREISGADCG